MNFTRTKNGPTVGRDLDSARDDADIIFISEYARRLSAKEGAQLTGMTPSGFKKIQAGDTAISFKKLTHWMRQDHELAAAYAAHVGLILPGEAGFAGAITKAFNEWQRKGGV